MKQKTTRVEKGIKWLNNHKLFSIIIFVGIVFLGIFTFIEKANNVYNILTIDNNVPENQKSENNILTTNNAIPENQISQKDNIKKTYNGAIGLILSRYENDTLTKYGYFHSCISRRDELMNFFVPYNWDSDEPLDGPAGNRFKTFYDPNNPTTVLSVYVDIVCLRDIVDSLKNRVTEDKLDDEIKVLKKIAGIDSISPEYGFCNLSAVIENRLKNIKSECDEFLLISSNPSNKYYFEKETGDYYAMEGHRLKYKFKYNGEYFIVNELLTMVDKLCFTMYLGAKELEYEKHEEMFLEISSNFYFESLF